MRLLFVSLRSDKWISGQLWRPREGELHTQKLHQIVSVSAKKMMLYLAEQFDTELARKRLQRFVRIEGKCCRRLQ